MNNITEIVYGDSLCHTINQCDFIKGSKIIKFDKFLSFADLSNIDKNIIKLSEDFCESIYHEIYHKFETEESIEELNKELDEAANTNSKIRIWTTHQEIESYLTLLYVCYYLFNSTNLYVVFSDEYDKEYYTPACMNELELEKLEKMEHKLSKEEILAYALEWKKILNKNSEMRIIEEGKVKCVSFDYYNNVILNRLKELGEVKVVTLSANLMKDYHMYDIFISYLIKRLIKSNEIIIVEEGSRLWNSIVTVAEKK